MEEGRELTTGPGISPFHLPKVDRDLIDHDQGGLAAEQFPNGLGPRGDVPLVALLDPPIAICPSQTVGQLTPEGLGPEAALDVSPSAGSLFSPSRAATRTDPFGNRAGSTNSSIC